MIDPAALAGSIVKGAMNAGPAGPSSAYGKADGGRIEVGGLTMRSRPAWESLALLGVAVLGVVWWTRKSR